MWEWLKKPELAKELRGEGNFKPVGGVMRNLGFRF
jgi:hypothetical protein